jgi:hypothetical protein
LENAAENHPFIDPVWLETVLRNVAHAPDGLLEDPEMKLALAANVVLEDARDRHECVLPGGEKNFCRAVAHLSAPDNNVKIEM